MEHTQPSAMQRLDAADRLLHRAIDALSSERAFIAVAVALEDEDLRLRLRDSRTGWEVMLAFRETEVDHVRRRVMDALRLRSWHTAPPAVRLEDGARLRLSA